jgi:hypothetical protein
VFRGDEIFQPAFRCSVSNQEKERSKKGNLSIHNEVLDDIKVLFRPGIRFERAYDRPAYDSGTRKNQFSFAMDVIFKF